MFFAGAREKTKQELLWDELFIKGDYNPALRPVIKHRDVVNVNISIVLQRLDTLVCQYMLKTTREGLNADIYISC